jgi:creatinine amidohydrolase
MTGMPTETADDIRRLGASVAILPIGSFEQHGSHLPMATDSLIATLIAQEVAAAYGLVCLPPITISCSHEHTSVGPAVSIRANTLYQVVNDVAASLNRIGVSRLVLVNGHGGNYVLSNVVQEANEQQVKMGLFPSRADWEAARLAAGLDTTEHEDMHAGELETSLVLYAFPELVTDGYRDADHSASDRRHLLMLGMAGYSASGVIGSPSLATVDKGKRVAESLVGSFAVHMQLLTRPSASEGVS